MMLPAVLDPWAGHALYEAANLAKNQPGSKVWLVSLGPKAKLQQVMMTVAQKVPFELVALDGPASGFTEAAEVASCSPKPSKPFPVSTNPSCSSLAAGNPPRAARAQPCKSSGNDSASWISSRAWMN